MTGQRHGLPYDVLLPSWFKITPPARDVKTPSNGRRDAQKWLAMRVHLFSPRRAT